MAGTSTSIELKDLKLGDVIYANVVVDINDVADPKSKSTTAKAIRNGKAVKRICIVLVTGDTSVEVTYSATFKESTTLPTGLDKTLWYPFSPATKEGSLDPLPKAYNDTAQWASLRKKHTITENPVAKLGAKLPDASAKSILAAMKA